MSSIALQAKARSQTGKGAARKSRAAGNIPAVLYGPGEQPLALEIETPEFMRIYHGGHGENVLIDLTVDSSKPKKVLFREVQRDPVTESVLHVDFYHVSLTKPIKVHVPVHLEGIPAGVKLNGGILQHVLREVEVECLPAEIPESVTIDVSGLDIHDAVHISDLPAGAWTYSDESTRTIASVIPPVVSKEATAEEAEAEAALAGEDAPTEPERIGEKDAEEGEDDKKDKKDKKDG